MMEYIIRFQYLTSILTFLIGFLLMPFVLKFAKAKNLVVRPNKRTSHHGNIPNIGGLDIFASLMPILVILLIAGKLNVAIFIGLCLIFLIGFIDDKFVLSAYWKIVGETLCAFFLIYFADIRITSLYGFFGVYELSQFISYGISYIIYISIINSLNLIDGVDGLASGMGILYSLFFGVWFYFNSVPVLSLICFAIVGSLVVFFLFNVFGKSKRKIFMGDSGSLMLGYLITFMAFSFLEYNKKPDNISFLYFPYAPATIFCLLFVPMFDMIRVSLTRIKKRQSIMKPDKNHIHHLLLLLGFSHKKVTFILLTISMFFISIAIVLKNYNLGVQLLISILIGLLIMFFIWQLINIQNKKQK